jgi:rRNA maturation protein Nop10
MSRILIFPEPYPDEDLRSINFRYHLRSHNVEFYESRLELYGMHSYKQSIFPKRLNYLMGKLPIGHTFTLEQLLYDHTWFGLYKVFFMPNRLKRAMEVIEHGLDKKKFTEGQPTTRGQSVLSSEVRYCPLCIKEDEENIGEIYVHRMHQISFLESCPKHLVRLMSKCSVCNESYANYNSGMLLRSGYCSSGHEILIEHVCSIDKGIQLQYQLLNDLVSLREQHQELNLHTIYYKLFAHLFREKYITLSGKVLKKELMADLISYYTIELFNRTNITSEEISSEYFKNQILNRETMTNFLGFYLLLIRFLCGSLDHFLHSSSSINIASPVVFGYGPWACRHSKCLNFNIPLIKKCVRKVVNFSKGIYNLKYTCNCCGISTVLTGTPNRYNITNIRDKKINPFENSFFEDLRQAQFQISATTEQVNKLKKIRGEMIKILQIGFKSRKRIYLQNKALYLWLSKNDKVWMESKLPEKRDMKERKLDFTLIDQELCHKVRAVGERIDSSYHLPIREGTIRMRLEALDRNRFKNYRDFLPLSNQEITKYIETHVQFLIRSIPRFYEKFVKRGITKMTVRGFKSASLVFYKVRNEELKEIERHIYEFLKERGALI